MNSEPASGMTIGRLADAAGVTVETIRFYQRRGLLVEPPRPMNGQRHYPSSTVKRVRFIKRAQLLGFSLEEVIGLLGLDEAHACAQTRDLAAQKLELIEGKLADLTAMREALSALMHACDAAGSSGACPIIRTLAAD